MSEKRQKRDTIQRNARPKRLSVAEQRNKLTVQGKDPNRVYRWVSDLKAGARLQMFLDAGYIFETDSKNLEIGDETVSKSDGIGSAIREYGGIDREGKKFFNYLMSIERELYDMDQAAKAREVDEIEEGIANPEALHRDKEESIDYVKDAKIGGKVYRDADLGLG